MCRFTFYHGPPLLLSSLITEPENSLIHQSFESQEREEPLNGDGFGVAWYSPRGVPGLFRSVTPAWNNANLASLARVVESTCILAHVRAATQIQSVGEVNCHPFVSARYAFMHNGDLGGFPRLRRALIERLSDERFAGLQGQTDSEHVFALMLDRLASRGAGAGAEVLALAFREALAEALALSRRLAPGEPSDFNAVLTDGEAAVVSRFTTRTDYAGESLHWSCGRRYACENGICRMRAPEAPGPAVLVSSERLSEDPDWAVVPKNHLLLVSPDRTVRLERIEL
ncbi:MAG: class II glutamine amidotransferase [Planctomycetota bacterium]